jgi:hypothetical protein
MVITGGFKIGLEGVNGISDLGLNMSQPLIKGGCPVVLIMPMMGDSGRKSDGRLVRG